jgi:hypothetical protein
MLQQQKTPDTWLQPGCIRNRRWKVSRTDRISSASGTSNNIAAVDTKDNTHSSDNAPREDRPNGQNGALIRQGSKTPIACTLAGDDLVQRKDTVDSLLDQAQQVRELPDGYAFGYPPTREWADKLLTFSLEERQCCPFFTFETVFEANNGPLWLRLVGSEDVKEFVKEGLLSPR